jgi:mannose-6-phosphate isomerase-like protein (cupin superfamily)
VPAVSETPQRTTVTPAATMYGLAAPSQGSRELSTWRIEIGPTGESPVHVIDHEQVWMPISGAFEFDIDGDIEQVTVGQALTVPAGAVRRFRAAGVPAQALVCMRAGGKAGLQGQDISTPLPWAR